MNPPIAIRSSVGIEFWNSPSFKAPYEPNSKFIRDESKNCRTMAFSPDGQYFAYSNGVVLKIINTKDWSERCVLPRPKVFHLKFSPEGKYLVTWELFIITKDNPEGAPNMHVYKMETGEEVFSIIQKKQTDWEPCWSSNESIFALMVGGEAVFYELNGEEDFQTMSNKLGGGRNGLLSLSPGNSPPFIAFYVPGVKGAPSMCKIFKYPTLEQNQIIACKSFYQADRVEMLWNKRGTGLLLLTSTEVDQSGASYYGKQALHFMSTKGDSYSVQLSKKGPIHSVSWSPKANEFVVVYGSMPAKATLYNLKCDEIFDFGEGSRNSNYFNDFGNLLIFGGFGNLRGYIEVWDMNEKKKISTLQAPDTTLLEWSPNGEIFITATTAPRLRIGNGFKVWHYSGALLHETLWPEGQELLEVAWQKYSKDVFKEPKISYVKIEGIKSITPEASKQVYEPPNVRLMKEGKLPPEALEPNLPPGYPQKNSINAQRKRRKPRDKNSSDKNNSDGYNSANKNSENSKDITEAANENDTKQPMTTTSTQKVNQHKNVQHNRPRRYSSFRDQIDATTGDPEKDKRIRHISRKLQDISKLKSKQNRGETLTEGQMTKVSNEKDLINELKSLKLS